MTEIRQSMQQLAIQLLVGSILLSLFSITGVVALIGFQTESTRSDTPVAPIRHSAVHQMVQVAPTSSKSSLSAADAPQRVQDPLQARDVQGLSHGERSALKKRNTLPAQTLQEENEPLRLIPFNDEIYVLLNERKLSKRQQQRVLSRLALLPVPPTPEQLLSERGVPLLQRPFYYGRIVDQQGRPVRYPLQAARLAEQWLAQSEVDDQGWRVVRIALKGVDWTERAQAWVEPVRRLAGGQAPLVLAVMEVESGFRPDAVSRSGAVGLMQIKPDEAGRDVADILQRPLDHQRLLEPMLNLQAGVTYLKLLQQRYLAGVVDPRSREYLAIAAYNGGINAVLRQFGKTADVAIARINRLKPEQVYRILRHQFPRRETRLYLEKVTQAKTRYRAWMENNV